MSASLRTVSDTHLCQAFQFISLSWAPPLTHRDNCNTCYLSGRDFRSINKMPEYAVLSLEKAIWLTKDNYIQHLLTVSSSRVRVRRMRRKGRRQRERGRKRSSHQTYFYGWGAEVNALVHHTFKDRRPYLTTTFPSRVITSSCKKDFHSICSWITDPVTSAGTQLWKIWWDSTSVVGLWWANGEMQRFNLQVGKSAKTHGRLPLSFPAFYSDKAHSQHTWISHSISHGFC